MRGRAEQSSLLLPDAATGLEPHSVLPVSVIAFHPGAPGLPVELESREKAALASSAIFRVPFVKHLWSWLGLQSVDRRNMRCVGGHFTYNQAARALLPGALTNCSSDDCLKRITACC